MKSTSKLVLAALTLAGAALMTGCENVPSDSDPLYSRNNQGFNIAGIVDSSPDSYVDVAEYSNVIYSDELMKRKNISGDNVSLFWGTIVFADY